MKIIILQRSPPARTMVMEAMEILGKKRDNDYVLVETTHGVESHVNETEKQLLLLGAFITQGESYLSFLSRMKLKNRNLICLGLWIDDSTALPLDGIVSKEGLCNTMRQAILLTVLAFEQGIFCPVEMDNYSTKSTVQNFLKLSALAHKSKFEQLLLRELEYCS